MRKFFTALFLLGISASPYAAQTPQNGFCVNNSLDFSAIFAVDAGENRRQVQELSPGETLCTPEFDQPAAGFVSIFLSLDALEGCSRLSKAGSTEILLGYHDFDVCKWQTVP